MARFVWYELLTTECPAAAAFYGHVIGWSAADAGMPGVDYTIFSQGATQVAGTTPVPAPGVDPHWIGYISVDDVDRTTQRVVEAGGRVHREPTDIPTVGRFSAVDDPQGAGFCLFRPSQGGTPSADANAPGFIGWHELHALDVATALAFYETVLGFTKDEAMDMGPAGTYQMFALDNGVVGGIVTKTTNAPVPHWLYYFNVATLDAAVARALERGAKQLMPAQEVPGPLWVTHLLDPQGALFALVAPQR